MSETLQTVEQAAQRLRLHPKTVLRAIREGRLRATRVGKSYRILQSDLDAFAGVPARAVATTGTGAPWITTVVDLPGIDSDMAQKWARWVTDALNARPPGGPPLRADVIHDPERAHLKIIVVGPPGDVVNLMNLIRVWLEQLAP
jgi:excisionase family DNA binding protein